MKKRFFSILALTLIVLMSVVLVSCEDMLPVAPQDVVNYVDIETKANFDYFGPFVEELLDGVNPDNIENEIKVHLAAEFSTENVSAQADSSNPATLSASATGDNSKLSVLFSNLSKSAGEYKGNFSIESNKRPGGTTRNMKVKGTFDSSSANPIVFTSVNFNGTDYDVDAFNNAL